MPLVIVATLPPSQSPFSLIFVATPTLSLFNHRHLYSLPDYTKTDWENSSVGLTLYYSEVIISSGNIYLFNGLGADLQNSLGLAGLSHIHVIREKLENCVCKTQTVPPCNASHSKVFKDETLSQIAILLVWFLKWPISRCSILNETIFLHNTILLAHFIYNNT